MVTVCHFPPGTSKWNRIEHRLFSHISMNWQVSDQELAAVPITRHGWHGEWNYAILPQAA